MSERLARISLHLAPPVAVNFALGLVLWDDRGLASLVLPLLAALTGFIPFLRRRYGGCLVGFLCFCSLLAGCVVGEKTQPSIVPALEGAERLELTVNALHPPYTFESVQSQLGAQLTHPPARLSGFLYWWSGAQIRLIVHDGRVSEAVIEHLDAPIQFDRSRLKDCPLEEAEAYIRLFAPSAMGKEEIEFWRYPTVAGMLEVRCERRFTIVHGTTLYEGRTPLFKLGEVVDPRSLSRFRWERGHYVCSDHGRIVSVRLDSEGKVISISGR